MIDSDPLPGLRSLCEPKRPGIHLPIWLWSLLLWVDGLIVGATLTILLMRVRCLLQP